MAVDFRIIALAILLVAAAAFAQTGLFSFVDPSTSRARLNPHSCIQTGETSIRCTSNNEIFGDGIRGSTTAVDGLSTEFDEMDAGVYDALENGGILLRYRDDQPIDVEDTSAWHGSCKLTGWSGVDDDGATAEATITAEGELTDFMGCRLMSGTVDYTCTNIQCSNYLREELGTTSATLSLQEAENLFLIDDMRSDFQVEFFIEQPDRDGDGVPDSEDACPDQAGDGDDGCPVASTPEPEDPGTQPVDGGQLSDLDQRIISFFQGIIDTILGVFR